MGNFDSLFLMDTQAIRQYAVEVLHFFDEDEETECREVGDGNINYVSIIRSLKDGRLLVIKQADRLLRSQRSYGSVQMLRGTVDAMNAF